MNGHLPCDEICAETQQHVPRLNEHLIDTWYRYFVEFLQFLTSNLQLISVMFVGLLWYFKHIDTPIYEGICKTLAYFLRSQHHLKRVDFHFCFFGCQKVVDLLKNLTENIRESLSHLTLRRFVRYEPVYKEQNSTFLQNLSLLFGDSSFTTLEIDSLIFENMVASLSNDIQTLKIAKRK
ncbi:hypothetical protein AVEN_154779-1 [Araneus ventricosus]|uniref:Uncharacterized protein n=1 Tax=Araneus ventricosus TaxID=182803 RepID=A0A4Y2BUF8_ARAVE|nr:hypothetical protein AVEN_154779-1 [Araneus ventricosus]